MSDETSFCKHCKRFVPTTTFTLHSTHCERFIQICTKCQEPFPKTQLEEHDNEVHKEINCKDCGQKVEVRDQVDHLANHCSKRLISCQYCEVQCIAGNIEDHELACGSRTEVCDICRNHILVRMLKIHEKLHKSPTATIVTEIPRNIPNESKEKVVNVEDKNKVHIPKFRNVICQNILQASATLPTSQKHSKTKTNRIENTLSKIIRNNGPNTTPGATQQNEDEEKHSLPCEFCGASCTTESLEKHQMLCSSNLEICSRCQKYFTFGQLTSHVCSSSSTERGPVAGSSSFDEEYWSRYVDVAPTVKEGTVGEEDSIPCENCGSLFPISCLELHEIACKFSSVSTKTGSAIHGDEIPTQFPTTPTTIDEDYWSQYENATPINEDRMAEEEVNIPCENCGIPFPLSSFELHEVSCKFSTLTRKEIMTSETGIAIAQENATSQPTNEVQFLPCSFCNVVISSSILEMHEARCSNFSKQQIIRSQISKSLPKKTEVKNTRPENDNQRALRENTLLATENRLPNTPKIQQSQYKVVQLPDGREMLKKRNPTIDNNGLDMGHVLGRSRHGLIEDDLSFRPKSVNSNSSIKSSGNHFDVESNRIDKEIKKSLFQPNDFGNHPVTSNSTRKFYTFGDVQKGNYPEKKNITTKPFPNRSTEICLSKKPNAAFMNYAYKPDAGNKLGRGNGSPYERKHMHGEKTSTFGFRPESATVKGQPKDGKVNSELQQPNARDRTNEAFLGARPKRPQQ